MDVTQRSTKQTPVVAAGCIPRARLSERLDEAVRRRLTLVVGDAGFGKSTAVVEWAQDRNVAWYGCTADDADLTTVARGIVGSLRLRMPGLPPDLLTATDLPGGPIQGADDRARSRALAALLCDALETHLTRDLILVLDDVHEAFEGGPALTLIEALSRQAPPLLHVVLTSRADVPFPIERMRGQGQVLEVSGSELAFTIAETEELLTSLLDPGAVVLAPTLHATTGGWPAGTRLAVEALRDVPPEERPRALQSARDPGGPLLSYLAHEVLDREPAPVRELIRTAAQLERFTLELLVALGVPAAEESVGMLVRRGIFLSAHEGIDGWFSLNNLMRLSVLGRFPLEAREREAILIQSARWFENHGHTEEALSVWRSADAPDQVSRMLGEQGRALVAAGATGAVIAAADWLGPQRWDPHIAAVVGEARQTRGDWEGALVCYEQAARGMDTLPASLAWRMGLIHHLRGEIDDALKVYERGTVDGSVPAEEAMLLSWRATAHWLRSEADPCRLLAEHAMEAARASQEPRALAAAHTVFALLAALDGDRRANDSHYLRALEHAERARDVLQTIRIRTNRSSRYLEEAAYEDALAEVQIAIRLAELAGSVSFRALGLTNRGEACFRLGRFEEAIADLEASKELYQRLDSRMIAYPLGNLGEVYLERGDTALARAAFEEAIHVAEEQRDMQGLVPSLAGLARVLVKDDPEQASLVADRALSVGPGLARATALLALGWVAFQRGDRDAAMGWAEEAAAVARARRDRAALAEALELQALAGEDGASLLEEAAAIWRDIGSPLGQARVDLWLARLTGGTAGRALAERAERRFRALGARGYAAEAADVRSSFDQELRPAVAVHTLGGFRVVRAGVAVTQSEWQSKKARDLVKILVARRGRPVAREYLMETLWPDEDPAKVSNRLSVALSVARGILGDGAGDPLPGDNESIGLDASLVAVDVEGFLADATSGLALRRSGRSWEARGALERAEAAYAGDFLEEDPYADWAVPLREEARAAYISVARALAEDAAAADDHDAAARACLRILERDPYDEGAHLSLIGSLVTARRYGEARRSYRLYCSRMEEIEVEPAPFPTPSGRSGPPRSARS